MDMTQAKMLAIHNRVAVYLKRRGCERVKGHYDMNPVPIVTFDDGTHYIGKAINAKMGPEFNLGIALPADVMILWLNRKQPRPIERVIIVADAYVQAIEDAETIEEITARGHQPGRMGEDFRTNPNTTVREGMFTSFVWWDEGDIFYSIVSQRYTYADRGQINWADVEPNTPIVHLTAENKEQYGTAIEGAYVVIEATHQAEEAT